MLQRKTNNINNNTSNDNTVNELDARTRRRIARAKKRRMMRLKRKSEPNSTWTAIGFAALKVLAFVFTFVIVLAATLLICLNMIANYQFDEASSDDNDGNNISAVQQIFVPTLLETGQLKFLASWFLSEEEIQAIVDSNSMKELNEEIDNTLINIGGSGNLDFSGGSVGLNTDPIEIHEVSGSTFYGTMMIVKDPSRVSLATIYPWRTEGVTLDELVKSVGAVGGINGGLYNSNNNSGGRPYGVVVSNGEIQLNEPQSWKGLVLIGLTEENILQIIDISKMNSDDIIQLVEEKGIRDAVTFQEEASDANNHFVQLIINGEEREMNGMGSGLNPRTAIGQRADGAILMLVTDGRGKSGHLGASAADLIGIMKEYGAVNAANLDGGSSSCMYYDDEYLMTSLAAGAGIAAEAVNRKTYDKDKQELQQESSVVEAKATFETEKPSYILGEHDGRVAVYLYGSKEPEIVFNVYLHHLPDVDRFNLQNGIEISDYQTLLDLIEDYTS